MSVTAWSWLQSWECRSQVSLTLAAVCQRGGATRLVTSDDYALLAGLLGLFAILAVAMVLTCKVNWYVTTE
jgi:inner membrane protein involved in colicin E2 resistance